MIKEAIRMNDGDVCEYLIMNKEPNTDSSKFFNLLKDSNELLWNKCNLIIDHYINVHHQVQS